MGVLEVGAWRSARQGEVGEEAGGLCVGGDGGQP